MDSRPIGVFDSGVGGLTVFKALEQALPDEALVYLGDTARVPYGIKSTATVQRYSAEAARFFAGHDVKLIVVACNTASSVGLAPMADAGVPVLGVIEPGARKAVEMTRRKRIGVIGTRATITSEAYQDSIREIDAETLVVTRACPLFVPLAEEGWTASAITRQIAEVYLAHLRGEAVDTLVLGCTHYPLLRGIIGDVMGPGVTLVDSAETVAARAREILKEQGLAAASGANVEHRFFVTDTPEPFQAVAERFLGRVVGQLEQTIIEH